MNEALYNTFVGPFVRACSNQVAATGFGSCIPSACGAWHSRIQSCHVAGKGCRRTGTRATATRLPREFILNRRKDHLGQHRARIERLPRHERAFDRAAFLLDLRIIGR